MGMDSLQDSFTSKFASARFQQKNETQGLMNIGNNQNQITPKKDGIYSKQLK